MQAHWAPRVHTVLAIALLLSLRVLWNLATGTVDVTAALIECLGALVVAWMGTALVKAAIVAYLPAPKVPELEPWRGGMVALSDREASGSDLDAADAGVPHPDTPRTAPPVNTGSGSTTSSTPLTAAGSAAAPAAGPGPGPGQIPPSPSPVPQVQPPSSLQQPPGNSTPPAR